MRARALRKAAVAAGINCLIALAAGLLLLRRGGELDVAPPDGARAEAGTVAGAPLEAPAEHGAAFEETVAEEAAPLELRGTLVIVDADGAEHREENGEFLMLRSTSGEEPIGVAVTAGKWRAVWPEPTFPTELHLMGIHAGGTDAEVEGRIPVSAEGEVHIRATWSPPDPILEVIGKDTGEGLREITVILGSYNEDGALNSVSVSPHSGSFGPELTIVESGDSPVALERSPENARRLHGKCSVWARAPGYAWGSTEIDFARGGRHLLVLEREAVLEVSLLSRSSPGTEDDRAVLRIRRTPDSKEIEDIEEIDELLEELTSQAEAKQVLDEQIASLRETREKIQNGCEGETVATVVAKIDGPTRIEGLPAGSFAVCVEGRRSLADPPIRGSAFTELRAGETTRLAIALADREPMVPFEGTIEVPEKWREVGLSVHVERLDKTKVSRGQGWQPVESLSSIGPGIHAWSAGKVPSGRYQVIVYEFALVQVFEVPPEGKRDALIRVGEPVQLRVKVVDAGTGEAIPDARVSFSPEPAADGASVPTVAAEEDPDTGDHIIAAPVGRLRIQAEDDGYRSGEEALDLGRGPTSVTLRLERGCGAFLTLDGTMPADRREFLMGVRLEPQEGSGRILAWQWVPAEVAVKVTVDSPGLYELRVPRVEGLAPVEPIRIQIPPDRYVEQTITLRRE